MGKEKGANASSSGRIPASCPPNFSGRYTVRSGDTMFFIAQRFNVGLSALVAANPHITNPNRIFPGDVLCVPGPTAPSVPVSCPPGFQGRYTVQPGDTMFFIAQTFGVSLSALIAANPHIPNPNLIFPGDVLCVPGAPPVELPCCVILFPATALPAGALGSALFSMPAPNLGEVSVIAIRLPAPGTFGNFDAYAAQVLFPPPVSGGPGFILEPVPADAWAGSTTFPVPPGIEILTAETQVFVQPINTQTGATGPRVLANTLAQCC